MSVFARLRAIDDKDKAALVRQLMESSTADFDYFYLIGLSVLMATFGLMLDSGAIVIGSMLLAPLMYPILGLALGLVMSNYSVFARSIRALSKSFAVGIGLSIVAALFFGPPVEQFQENLELLSRANVAEPHIYLFVAMIAGAAVSYVMARPEWSATIPGVAIAVALIPPLAAFGIGLAYLDPTLIKGAGLILILNLFGIIGAAFVIFSLMNLGEKQKIAESTIKKEEQKLEEEQQKIDEVTKELNGEDHKKHI